MKIKSYFSKDFKTSDNEEIESLRTHYYRSRRDVVMETVIAMAKDFNAKVKNVDEERGEIIFDHLDFNACATITAVSYSEIAVDFNILTFNILPTAPGKKFIEKFYNYLDKKLELKGIALHR